MSSLQHVQEDLWKQLKPKILTSDEGYVYLGIYMMVPLN